MTDKTDHNENGVDKIALRDAAEKKLSKSPALPTELADKTSQDIIHELLVHQIELKMQNEELRRIQIELEKSKDKYVDLYDFAPVGYFTLSPKGIIAEANLTGASLLGMSRSILRGRGFGHFVTPESEQTYYQHINSVVKQEGKLSCVLTLKSETGSTFYSQLESIPIDTLTGQQGETGETRLIRTMVSDVTERKRLEHALHESEIRFRGMFEKHGAVMLLIEPMTGQIMDANKAAERFYGYTLSTLRSMFIQDINILPPDEVAQERTLALQEKRDHFIFPHRLSNGEVRTVEVHSTPIQMGEQTILFSIIHDVTDRKLLEEERSNLIVEIQNALAQVKKLSGFLPICASCKKIRDDKGYWQQVENYISDHSEALFSHGICPDCIRKLYPEYAGEVLASLEKDEKK